MKKLTEDIIQLHQMMVDFSTLVQEQGYAINSIEAQVCEGRVDSY